MPNKKLLASGKVERFACFAGGLKLREPETNGKKAESRKTGRIEGADRVAKVGKQHHNHRPRKLAIKYREQAAIIIHKIAFKHKKLVYVTKANKEIKYTLGKSGIAYIGMTKKGAGRIASSAVWKGADLLFEYGIKHLEYHIVLCQKNPV